MSFEKESINPEVEPSGTGCVECLENGTWWVHLRRCAQCGHIGCCNSSPHQHATRHYHETGHSIMTSYEPGEDWFYNYETQQSFFGPRLADPQNHPLSQPVPGPEGKVPPDWQSKING